MIRFHDWVLSAEDRTIGYQYDHNTRVLLVTGDMPEGWRWELLVQVEDKFDILALVPMGEGFGVLLTRDQLCIGGRYCVQLRGRCGEMVRHSNLLAMQVEDSMDGTAHWPVIPSAFVQLEQKIHADADRAEAAVTGTETAAAAAQTAAGQAARDQAAAAGSAAAAEVSRISAAQDAETATAKADAAAKSAELAQQGAAEAGYLQFEIDEAGNLIYTRTENVRDVNFALEEGELVYYA